MPELSVLIPARNEMFLEHTIEDVLENAGADTEVIAVLDGYWPKDGLPIRKGLTVVHRPESIGQRAATNEAARLSSAPYIMKLDAHCSVAPGFDLELIRAAEELGPDVTQIPAQYNLHAFDWVCAKGHRRYQGPSGPCENCGGETKRELVWKRRKSRLTTAWRFDANLKFQYWREFEKRPEGREEISETLSCLGACWFLSRDRYWELGGMDEAHGSWGQMGTELGCKSWLSGGRMVCNKRTWFAHMFRTQGGDFGFPYELRGKEVNQAREYSRDLWIGGKWSGAKRPLSWLIERFAPVPGWESKIPSSLPAVSKGAVYYSDCRPDPGLLEACQSQLRKATNGHQIVTSCLDYVPLGDVRIVHASLERGYLTMFRQILAGLEMSTADVVFLCEHDVLYHPSHFDFTPPKRDVYYYNQNTWKVSAEDGQALFYYCNQTSGLCAYRDLLIDHYRKRVERVEREGFTRRMGFEPGTHRTPRGVDDHPHDTWMSAHPNIDVRHAHNLTPSRWSQDQFRNKRFCQGWKMADAVPGWGKTKGRFWAFLEEIA